MIRLEKVADKNQFRNILQKYLYEMSQFYEDEMDEAGNYPYRYFDSYFEDAPDRKALYMMEDDLIVGFALINRHSAIGSEIDHAVAEFTVFPAYRKRSCGSEAVKWILAQFPGRWEIKYSLKNSKAAQFWTKVTQQFKPRVVNLKHEEQLLLFSTASNEPSRTSAALGLV